MGNIKEENRGNESPPLRSYCYDEVLGCIFTEREAAACRLHILKTDFFFYFQGCLPPLSLLYMQRRYRHFTNLSGEQQKPLSTTLAEPWHRNPQAHSTGAGCCLAPQAPTRPFAWSWSGVGGEGFLQAHPPHCSTAQTLLTLNNDAKAQGKKLLHRCHLLKVDNNDQEKVKSSRISLAERRVSSLYGSQACATPSECRSLRASGLQRIVSERGQPPSH